jgi:DNA-directed RNA polymerase specialized sigma subunit
VQTATEGLLVAINRWSFEKSNASCMHTANQTSPDSLQAAVPARAQIPDCGEDTAQPDTAPDLPRSSRLATYAMCWMRLLLTNSVIETRGMIVRAKNPKVRKALFNLPSAIRKLDIRLPLSGSDVSRIAAHLGVGEQEIKEALAHAAGDVMLDEPVGDGGALRGDVTADERAEGEDGILNRLASADRWDAVCEALMELPARERFILITRYLLDRKWKLDRLSDTLKMSRERIRQIAADGLTRIQQRVGSADVSHDPARRHAAAEAQALVNTIEHASASADPDAMPALFRDQRIVAGPTRITQRRPATGKMRPLARRPSPQAPVPALQPSAA